MQSPDKNKGNLQFLAGELIHAWSVMNVQTQGDTEINDKAVFTLDAIAYPKTREDEAFQEEFMGLDNDTTKRVDVRYRQMRLLIWKLYDSGILQDKGVPTYGEEEDGA